MNETLSLSLVKILSGLRNS